MFFFVFFFKSDTGDNYSTKATKLATFVPRRRQIYLYFCTAFRAESLRRQKAKRSVLAQHKSPECGVIMKQSIEYIRINDKRLLIRNPAGLDTYLALAYTRVKDGGQLYCSENGEFYSLSAKGLNPVKHRFSPAMACSPYTHGGAYPSMRHFGGKLCHHLMWEAWIGPRTKGMEIDHINGNKFDYRLENLEEVTPKVNRERAKIIRALRAQAVMEGAPALAPENRPISQIKQIFKQANL